MITVAYDDTRNVLCISGIAAPFPAGSLVAKRIGDQLAVASPHDGTLICGWADFGLWTFPTADASGEAPLGDADSAFAVLSAICTRAPARVPPVSAVAAQGCAAGMPLAIGRGDGQLHTARADTYALAFVAGLAEADGALGFPVRAVRTALALTDWTAVAGSPSLTMGQPYFLAPQGGLTLSPDRTTGAGLALVRVGSALAPNVLAFAPSPPILL